MPIRLSKLNTKPRSGFALDLIAIFEGAPWIPQAAWDRRPFASVEQLYLSLLEVLDGADDDKKRALLGAQKDLMTRAEREDERTDKWDRERAQEVIKDMSEDEKQRFKALNAKYHERFGFPFVVDLRGREKAEVLTALDQRMGHDPAAEQAVSLAQLAQIARFRLERTVMV